MAQHGYLGDGYGAHGDVGDDRDWRSDPDNDWRDRERGSGRRSFMSDDRSGGWRGEDRSRTRNRDRDDEDRGFFDRAADAVGSWFSDDDRRGEGGGSWSRRESYGQARGGMGRERSSSYSDSNRQYGAGMSGYGREHGFGGFQGDYSSGGRNQGGFGGSGEYSSGSLGGQQRFSAHPDDHYRSWRDKQIQALDSDYQDYCREREQQFHSEFDSWRQNRQRGQSSDQSGGSDELMLGQSGQASRGGTTTGMTGGTSSSGSPERGDIAQKSATPESTATLGETGTGTSTRSGRSKS